MKVKIVFLLLSILITGCSFFEINNSNPGIPYTGSEPENYPIAYHSDVYPNGLFYRLHGRSETFQQPYYSSNLQEALEVESDRTMIQIPDIARASDFQNTYYFDSQADPEGDGSLENPFNSLDFINDGQYPDNSALLLKAGSRFFLSSLIINSRGNDEQGNPILPVDIYVGSYGDGPLPLITNTDRLPNHSLYQGGFNLKGNRITLNGLHLIGGTNENWAKMIVFGGTDVTPEDCKITIANCHIETLRTDVGYAHGVMKGRGTDLVLYHNEIAYGREDIWYGSSTGTYRIVSNYFHHANQGTLQTEEYNPRDRDTWKYYKGDIIQFEYEGLDGCYIANNFFDRSDSASKFSLAFNTHHDAENIVIEYNTFIGPLQAFGGASILWYSDGIVRDNLFVQVDPEGGVSAIASFDTYVTGEGNQVSGNHFVNYTENSSCYGFSYSTIGPDNLIYESIADYKASVSAENRKGSNIFANTRFYSQP